MTGQQRSMGGTKAARLSSRFFTGVRSLFRLTACDQLLWPIEGLFGGVSLPDDLVHSTPVRNRLVLTRRYPLRAATTQRKNLLRLNEVSSTRAEREHRSPPLRAGARVGRAGDRGEMS